MAKPEKRKSRKLRNFIFILVVIAFATVLATVASKSGGTKGEHKLASYMGTDEAKRGDIRQVVSAQGPLSPYDTVHVRSEASGRVAELFVETGDRVKVGDPLVELDQKNLLIELNRAKAAVEAAKANLDQQKKGWVPSEKSRVEQQIRTLEIDLNQRETDLARVEKLHAAGFASDSELEAAQYARNQAAVALQNAREQLDILLEGNPKEIVDYYQANYRMVKAEYDRAQTALGDATILSPMDGVVLQRFVTEGSVIVSSQASFGGNNDLVVLIGDLSRMKVKALVDETDIGKVQFGQKALITVDAFEGEEFEARVAKINPMGNISTTVTNFEVEMEIDNPEGKLLPNLTAYVDIVTNEVKDVLIVPDKAVLRSNGKDYVFVVDDDDILHQREVALGATDYENTEVLSGVEEGERVVSKGVPTQPFDAEKKSKKGKKNVKEAEGEPEPAETK
jgi:HlyD family secretion protein